MEQAASTHADPSAPATRKTVEDYGLIRHRLVAEPQQPGIVERFLPHPKPQDWQYSEIKLPPGHPANHGRVSAFLNLYAYSGSHNAYITNYIWLTEDELIGSPRYTEMRYRDMTVDNITAAGGKPGALRFLGVHNIINQAAIQSIKRVFENAQMSIQEGGVVAIRPGDGIFEECRASNPFLRGQVRLLEQSDNPTRGAFIKQVVFITEGFDAEGPTTSNMEETGTMMHMFTTLDRPTAPQGDVDTEN